MRVRKALGRAAAVVALAAVLSTAGCSFLLPHPPAHPSGQSSGDPGAGPRNMASDGIRFAKGLVADRTAAVPDGGAPTASKPSGLVDIRIFVDYQCPYCGEFEATNAAQIADWVESGKATLEIHPIAILDRASLGTKYSTRAANAMACVADSSPDAAFRFSALLFENQPREQTEGLDDDKLVSLAKEAGAGSLGSIVPCIDDGRFEPWVAASTARAIQEPIPGADVGPVQGTPTVMIGGQLYTGALDDAAAFEQFVQQSQGTSTI